MATGLVEPKHKPLRPVQPKSLVTFIPLPTAFVALNSCSQFAKSPDIKHPIPQFQNISSLLSMLSQDEGRQGSICHFTETRRVSSDFSRRTLVVDGAVRRDCPSITTSERVWVVSSLKCCFSPETGNPGSAVSLVAFERVSELNRIADSAFCESGLKSIVIPSTVIVLGKKSFAECTSLESVTFESGSRLERIEDSAFYDTKLDSIVIPSSVLVVGPESFCVCCSLETVIFEQGSRLERIEESAFSCTAVTTFEIPASVAVLHGSSFMGTARNSISVSPNNESFCVRDSLLESFDGSTIYRYFGACHSVIIPSTVVVLGKMSFAWCWSLESVICESGSRLERIEESAFSHSGLTSIVIPSSVVVVGKSCWSLCSSLESLIFESGSRLERIEESVFAWTRLRSMEIPPCVTFIDGSAFLAPSLTSISISPDNTAFRVREGALEDFEGSTIYRYFGTCHSVVVPSSVVVLGRTSFFHCDVLESVIFESDSRLERIEERAFAWSGLKSIAIPSSVVVLGKESFSDCTSLESVIFESGSRLERIEEHVFSRSTLTSIEIPPGVTYIDGSAFHETSIPFHE
jgi:hypothetical protein